VKAFQAIDGLGGVVSIHCSRSPGWIGHDLWNEGKASDWQAWLPLFRPRTLKSGRWFPYGDSGDMI